MVNIEKKKQKATKKDKKKRKGQRSIFLFQVYSSPSTLSILRGILFPIINLINPLAVFIIGEPSPCFRSHDNKQLAKNRFVSPLT